MKLVIVESPTKGRTIEKYLGSDYKVLASFGHVRDLPGGALGVDTEHDFVPEYRVLPKAKKTIAGLKDAMKKADMVYLATDYDREGEAIAWHLCEALGLDKAKTPRVTYHEITKDALNEAFTKPGKINIDLVNAQQSRRILDRLVGYKLSPFLWKKLYKGLSAGRVQSVAVRLIVDREREIQAFKAEEYWSIAALLELVSEDRTQKIEDRFEAQLVQVNGHKLEKLAIGNKSRADELVADLNQARFVVTKVEMGEQQKWPYPPFTTSTLQQEASKRLGYSAKKTMKLAQDLYEAGQITYMRTDSVNLAPIALSTTRTLIGEKFGKTYLPPAARVYKTKTKGAQEAHEAIRPTYVMNLPETLAVSSEDHRKLYDLLWRRLVASQMMPAVVGTTKVEITAAAKEQYGLAAIGSMMKFDGYLKVWPTKLEERTLPTLVAAQPLTLLELTPAQHSTEPPPRYNEASLIKALEEHGIGRPSTYAPTIATIVDRGYVQLEKRVFFPQEIGLIVIDLLKEHFPEIVDIGFTAELEEDLDKIAEGEANWVKVLHGFYDPFVKLLESKIETVAKQQLVTETTDEICEKCGKPMQVKMGRFGKFLACTGFPDCRNAKPIVVATGVSCQICGAGELVERKTRRGKTFWSCNRYPECQAATWDLGKPATLPDPNRPKWNKNSKSKFRNSKQAQKSTSPKK